MPPTPPIKKQTAAPTTAGAYELVTPTGSKTTITKEQADSYSQGANSLAPGYSVMPARGPANSISAENLNASPLTPPPASTKTGYAGLIESTNAVITDLTPKVTQGEADIKGVYDKLGQQNTARADAYTSDGVYDKQKTYNNLVNTMNAKDLAYRRKLEKISNENPTGQLAAGQQIEADKVSREWASEKADLAIAAAFAKDDYTLAKSIVDDLIKADTEDLTTQLAGMQFFYSQNYNKLSQAQLTQLQQETTKVQNELNDKKDLLTQIGAIQLEAAKNGAPASVITTIGASGDVTKAIAAGGTYIGLYDRMNADSLMNSRLDDGTGTAADIKFSDTQIANGAAAAGVSLEAFSALDKDTQNFFINGDLTGAKKSIDDAFANEGASLESVRAEINGMGLPASGQQYLLQYAEQAATANKALTPEETTQTLVSSLTDLKTGGYSRTEAYDAVTNTLTDSGKTALPKTLKNSIEDALVNVYGQTFWQKWLPGGR
jgi:hypothetical protein